MGAENLDTDWERVADARFVSFGTYRRSGELVSTPVWIGREGADLVVTSERATGKVRRLGHDPRVVLRPCSRLGAVDPDAPVVRGHGVVSGPDREHPSAGAALRGKYGWQFVVVPAVERLVRRLQRRPADRVILRVSRPAQ